MSLQKPTNLRVNLQKKATNITSEPKFSWWDESTLANTYQTQYQLAFAKTKVDLLNKNDLLLTDWQVSSQNTAVRCLELEPYLEAAQVYYWTVRIKDNYGTISDFADAGTFLTALTTFNASGIWAAETATAVNGRPSLGNFAFIRSPKFIAPIAQLDSGYLHVFITGNEKTLAQSGDIYLNDHCLGVGTPRPYEYYHDQDKKAYFYETFDVTTLLQAEDNVIAALVTGTMAKRAFFATMTAFLKNGQKETLIFTNDQWRSLDGSSAFGDYGATIGSQYFQMPQENIDLNFYPQHWAAKDFSDHDWEKATVIQPTLTLGKNELLLATPVEPTKRFLTNEPSKKITKIAPMTYIVDLGKEIIGGLAVDLISSKAQKINVYGGEQLTDEGHVRHHLACGPDYVENWQLTAGRNLFTTLQMKNFRYVELQGFSDELPIDAISGWAMHQDFDDQLSYFVSDQALLNEEYALSKYTIKMTNQDLYVDSQARERRAYEGDLLVNANSSYVVSDNYALARHSADYLLDNPTWPEDYKLFNVEALWYDYLYTGDPTVLIQRYDSLKEKLNRGATKTDNTAASWRPGKQADNFDPAVGLVTNNGLIDWPIRERDGYVEGKYNTPFNAIYVGIYQIMARIAKLTGHQKDYELYESRAQQIKSAMLTHLYDPTQGRFYDSMNADLTVNKHCSHHASAYALCYDVYDSDVMADKLSTFVANDGQFIGSIYFMYFMLKGLLNSGHAEAAAKLLLNDDCRKDQKTFAAIINQLQATIAPEAWSNYYKPNLTLSHPWGATPGLTIVQGIAGILPLKAGFETFMVRPRVGQAIKHFKLKTISARGPISLTYQRTETTTELMIQVPVNTTAIVDCQTMQTTVQVDDQAILLKDHCVQLSSGCHRIIY
ncbi:family 78 glycoside hydrolase catalytic domain [Agrilactobacillus yilanensis]|uniref:alpha-L-rhamnosidase n=1 Tax=Agrilactobacillus yilanensis TaxID=2485997 RepID=A0ABW4J4J8_9LACO|nr:family 78 glycoside hydrolase catalytic domain [Agrilactobacillus yilanensis]